MGCWPPHMWCLKVNKTQILIEPILWHLYWSPALWVSFSNTTFPPLLVVVCTGAHSGGKPPFPPQLSVLPVRHPKIAAPLPKQWTVVCFLPLPDFSTTIIQATLRIGTHSAFSPSFSRFAPSNVSSTGKIQFDNDKTSSNFFLTICYGLLLLLSAGPSCLGMIYNFA